MKGHSYRWEDRKAGLETDKYKPLEGLPAEQRHPLGGDVGDGVWSSGQKRRQRHHRWG